MAHIKTGPKRALIVLALVGGLFGYRQAVNYGYLPGPQMLKSAVPVKVETVDANVLAQTANVKIGALPSTSVASPKGQVVRFLVWEWNANLAALYANGGASTTKGSLMEQNGVRVRFERQDDTDEMRNQQVALAQDYCKSGGDTLGAHFVTIMGDQGAGYLGPANDLLKGLGADCQLEVVGSFGFSRGEDKFMGPPEWKDNPALAKGSLIAGAPREGDWNLFVRWAHANNVCFNPDERTFDPGCVNWLTATYTDAPKRYNANYCETRPLKTKPAEKIEQCVKGIVTWTPGDVTEAQGKGGLASLMDTGSAIFQMPAIIVGLKKWDSAHADIVAGIIAAAGEGADQVRANPAAMKRAGEISAAVYKDQDGDYWVKYFKGETEKDTAGLDIFLGGSAVSNIADEYQLFGLSGGPNLFKATYETFGNAVVQLYPNLFKSYPPASAITNTRYLKMANDRSENVDKGAAEKVTYDAKPMREVTGKRAYSINFATGSSQILPTSFGTLDEITGYLLSENTKVALTGHTDNTGSPQANRSLSQARAMEVMRYLRGKGGTAIPSSRISGVEGHGQDEPVASNATADGRAKNRRVEIALGR